MASKIFCTNCGAPNDASSRFCNKCGNKLASVSSEPSEPSDFETKPAQEAVAYFRPVRVREKMTFKRVYDLARASLMVLFCALFVAFSFLSVVNVNLEVRFSAKETTPVGMGVIDTSRVVINSVIYYDEDDAIAEVGLYGELLGAVENLSDYYEGFYDDLAERATIPAKYSSLVSNVYKLYGYTMLRMWNYGYAEGYADTTAFSYAGLFAMIFGIGQAAVSIAAFVYSLINLIGVIRGENNKKKERTMLKTFVAVLPLGVLHALFTMFYIKALNIYFQSTAASHLYYYGVSSTQYNNVTLSSVFVLTVVVAAIGVLLYAVPLVVKTIKGHVGTWIARTLSVVFAALLLCSVTFPIINAVYTYKDLTTSRNRTKTVSVAGDFFAALDTDEGILPSVDTSDITSFTTKEINDGKAYNANYVYTISQFISDGYMIGDDTSENSRLAFHYAYAVVVLLGAAGALALYHAVMNLVSEKSRSLAASATLAITFAILLLTLSVIVIVITNNNVPSVNFELKLGSGCIVSIVFAIILYIVPAFKHLDGKGRRTVKTQTYEEEPRRQEQY